MCVCEWVGGLVVGTMRVCGIGWVLAGGKCVGEWVGGLVVGAMWACGSGCVSAGGSVWVSGWVGWG